MKIDARLTFEKIRFDQETNAHLVLSITAPALEGSKRPSLCIVPVIDVSPSMEMPPTKLAYAKKSLLKLIDHLGPNDYCGLVSFSSLAQVVAKPVKMTAEAKEDLKRKVGGLHTSGGTNIADALLTGLSVANNMDLSAEVITRVVLFTDGAANTGVATTPEAILSLVSPNKGIASVSAFGYGTDAQQTLLGDMAKSGNGNYAFVQNPDDALSAFGKELGGLLSTYATNLTLELSALAGHEIEQVVSDVEAEEDLGSLMIKIPDILADEVRNIVVAVKFKEQKNAFPREVNVFDVKLGYDILDPNLHKAHKDLECKAKVQFVKPGEEQTKVDPELDNIVALAQIVRAQVEAEEFAKQGNYAQAGSVLTSVSHSIGTRGLAILSGVAQNLGDKYATFTSYNDSSSYLNSFSRGATRGMSVSSYDSAAAADLTSAGVLLSNASQASVAASFSAPTVPPAVVDLGGVANGSILGGSVTTSAGHLNIAGGSTGGGNSPILSWAGTPIQADPKAVVLKKPEKASKRKIKQKSVRW